MKSLLLAALAVPLGLGSPQEVAAPPQRVTISGAAYKKMHRSVPVYGGASHVADVLYAIGDGHDFIEVEVPVIAPLGEKIPQHPAIASGRLLNRLDVERIRMTKFKAIEAKDANGDTCVDVTATLVFDMPPAEDDQLAAEIIGLALGSDPRITVTSQPKAVLSESDGQFKIPGLALRVAFPGHSDEAPDPRAEEAGGALDAGQLADRIPTFLRSNAQGDFVRLGPVIIGKPKPLPADGGHAEGFRFQLRTTGKAEADVSITKIANFTVKVANDSNRLSQVGLTVEADEEGAIKMQALYDVR